MMTISAPNMKKIVFLIASAVCLSTGVSAELESGSTAKMTKPDTPTPMNATPSPTTKEAQQNNNLGTIDQPKQEDQLVGSSSSTWTPAYLKVAKFKECLRTENYRGWQGYCLPKQQPEECPDSSWEELTKMNLIPCSNESK